MDTRPSTDELKRIIAVLLERGTTGVCWLSAEDRDGAPIGELNFEFMPDRSIWVKLNRVVVDSPLEDDS